MKKFKRKEKEVLKGQEKIDMKIRKKKICKTRWMIWMKETKSCESVKT